MSENDEDEYCAVCGDSEFDDKGYATHEDEEEYDHDFVYEEDVAQSTLEHRETIKWAKITIIVAVVLALIFGIPSLIK